MDDLYPTVAKMLHEARHAIALTGAGISTESGIPDFRSAEGMWQQVNPMEVASMATFLSDPQRFWEFHRPRITMLEATQPNPGHDALAELERRGVIRAVVTQNIDRLHRRAGSREVIEVHGSLERGVCLRCDARVTLDELVERADAADDGVPRCDGCGFALKSGVVLFGEAMPAEATTRAWEHAQQADLVLVVGSSLAVGPVNQIPEIVRSGGGTVVILTEGDTPYDDVCDVRLRGRAGHDLPAIVAALDALEAAGS